MALSSLLKPSAQTQSNATQPSAQPQTKKVEPKVVVRKETVEIKKEPKVQAKQKIANHDERLLFVQDFGRELKKAELWFGEPGNGKTTYARKLCDTWLEDGVIEDYSVVNCDEELTVMSLLKTTRTDEDGNWKFMLNKVFDMLTDELQKQYVIIMDEFNTMPMSVMKALQPIIDDTVGRFSFEDKEYEKNPNVNFIFTMNHRDLGISELPIAIKDRLYPRFFEELSLNELSKRSGVPKDVITKIERVRKMFEDYGDLPEFHKSVRQLKNLKGCTGEEFRTYIIGQLALAQIEYKEAIAISPEFKDLMKEFDDIDWSV